MVCCNISLLNTEKAALCSLCSPHSYPNSITTSPCNMFPLYCINPALDRYVTLLDRTPHTWMMTSLNICGMDFYDLWHPHSHPLQFTSICPFCFHPDCFHLSQPPV